MKKTLIATALALLSTPQFTVYADTTGTISFTGQLTDTSCSVSINDDGPSATITLPTVSITELAAEGKTSGRTKFLMNLSNCTISTTDGTTLSKVSAYFQAGATVDFYGRLMQTDTSGATNVALQLIDGETFQPIVVGDNSQITNNTFYAIPGDNMIEHIPYYIEYYANGRATAGTVTSSVVYYLQYQ